MTKKKNPATAIRTMLALVCTAPLISTMLSLLLLLPLPLLLPLLTTDPVAVPIGGATAVG